MNRERRFASLVEKDSESLVEKDSESLVEKDSESLDEKDSESLVEKDSDCVAGERESESGGASSVRLHLLSAPGRTCLRP